MDINDIKQKVWKILPLMSEALVDVLSISPMYNARLTKTMGVRPYPKNRGNGNFLLWTLLRDERTAPDILGIGAIDDEYIMYSSKNILIDEDKHNDTVVNYTEETLKASYMVIQTSIQELCELLKMYIKKFPDKAYGGAFLRDMDINLCEYSASGEFVDYLIKSLLYQGVLDYTGEKGPRGSHMLYVAKDELYEIQPQIDPAKFRNGVSRGEALAAWTFSEFFPDTTIIHQKKWKDCRDKKELPFDFYDESNEIVVEIDGAQHFRPVEYFGGTKSFEYVKRHDSIKNDFVVNKGIKIIRIDSSTRDVKDCLVHAYSNLENLPIVSLYGEGYTDRYCTERIKDDAVVSFDNGLNIFNL